ncbi:MAG: ABC transporter permease [Lachnospiraceae bacterium]|nr:ABC transporter permease [Lachnospiraceae bacterium]
MTVFRGYLLIIKRNWGFIFVYTALFLLTMLIIQGETQKKEEKEFQRSRLKIAVVDEDGGMLAEGLTDYLSTMHDISEIGKEDGTLLEAIYYGDISSVVRIPEGVEEKWEVQLTKIPGYAESDYLKEQMNLFLNQVRFCTENGYSMQEAFALVRQPPEQQSVKLLNVNGNQGRWEPYYYIFRFLPYLSIAVLCLILSIPMNAYRKKEIRQRLQCSAVSLRRQSGEAMLAFLVVGGIFWAAMIGVAAAFSKNSLWESPHVAYLAGNSLLMVLTSLAMAFLIGAVAESEKVINIIVNVTALAVSFLGGVFTPTSILDAGILKFSRLLPVYWYEEVNNLLAGFQKISPERQGEIWKAFGIQLLFAVACTSVGMAVLKLKEQKED